MPTVTYLNGLLLFIAGLSIVRAHNYWTTSWPVLVTLTGWIAILGGLDRMFFPEAQQLAENISTYVFIIFLGVIGRQDDTAEEAVFFFCLSGVLLHYVLNLDSSPLFRYNKATVDIPVIRQVA